MTQPALAVQMPDGTRQYVHPVTGEAVPSVTSVLKCITKPELEGWTARTTARYALAHWDELSEMDPVERLEILKTAYEEEVRPKADRGTFVHELCESWSKGTPVKVEKSVEGYMTQFFSFLGQVNPVYIETEATMWNRAYGYAGTCDAVALIDNQVTLLDIKSGRGVYPENGLQVSALSHCEFIVDENGDEWEMPEITRLALLHLRPRSWRLIPVQEGEACFSAFLGARKVFRWLREVAPDVLGEPV
jgi:hypothetical protein